MEHPRWSWRATTAAGLAVLVLGGLSLFALPAAAAPSPNPGAPAQQWAYGASHYANASATTSFGEYNVSAFFGWTLVYTLTNTSNSSFELEAQRTMDVRYDAQLCAPTCSAARAAMNLSIAGDEVDTAFANFTTNATVVENGSMVAALGLENTHSLSTASLSESLSGARTVAGLTRSGGATLDVNGSAHAAVTFSTALGIVPWQLAPGAQWNSSAAFSGSGGFYLQYAWSTYGPAGNASGSGSPSGQINTSGTVDLQGIDLGNLTLANGVTTPVVALSWGTGTFVAVDGLLLEPRGFDIFSGGAHAWGLHAPGAQTILNARIDLVVDLAHHRVRVVAAASTYAGADSLSGAAPGGPVTPANDLSSPSMVQAQPMSVDSAQATASCWSGSCGSTGSAAASGGLHAYTAVLVGGLVIAVVVGTVGVIEYRVWSRRRSGGQLVGGYASQVPAEAGTPPEEARAPPTPPR